MARPRGPRTLADRTRRVGCAALLLLAGAVGCADWTGVRDVEFDDPYIRELEPRRPDGWLGRVSLYREYAAVDRAFRYEAEGRLDAAEAEVATYLEAHPEDARVRAYRLNLLDRLGRTPEVVDEATRLLEIEPEFVPALLARGRARGELGRPGAAADDLLAASRAPTVRPSDRDAARADAAHYTLLHAAELERDERWRAAAAAFDTALTLPLSGEQRAEARRGRVRMEARVALAEADLDRAAERLEALLDMAGAPASERAETLARLVDVRETQGDPVAAAVRLEELIALRRPAPGTAGLHDRAAALFLDGGRVGRAAAHVEAAARYRTGRERSRQLRRAAELYEDAGLQAEAVGALRAAVDAAPSDAALRAELGRMLVRVGRPEEAVEPLARALERDAGDHGLTDAELTASRRAFAAAPETAGRIDAAIALYEQIVAAEPVGAPARTEALERLVALHAERGDHRAAADAMMVLHEDGVADGRWALRAAESYVAVDALPEAADAYRAALAAGALTEPEGFRRAGVTLFQTGAQDEAGAVLERIPADERTVQDHRYLAAVALEAADTARALAIYERALGTAGTPGDSAALHRSVGYLQLGRNDPAAVEALTLALAREPDPAVRLDLARAQLRLGRADPALATLTAEGAGVEPDREPERLDLLAEVHAERGDTAGLVAALEAAAEAEPSADRFSRLGFLHERTGDHERAATAFERAYRASPSAVLATRAAYAHRRTGHEIRAATWFRRAVDAAADDPEGGADVDLDAVRREVGLLTDRLAVAAYVSLRGDAETAVQLPGGGVGQAAVTSQGGLEVRVLPLVQRVAWGREVDVFARLFWAFEDGLRVNGESYQGQLGIRYLPRWVPGGAVGVERWVALGSAARDIWAVRGQSSQILGRPYPGAGSAPTGFATLYGDVARLFDDARTVTMFGEARPGLAVPLSRVTTVLPHGTVSAYRQSPGGIGESYIEAGPGLGLRMRFPRESRYAKDYWSLQLMAQYRWGSFPDAWDAGGESYDAFVLTLVLRL